MLKHLNLPPKLLITLADFSFLDLRIRRRQPRQCFNPPARLNSRSGRLSKILKIYSKLSRSAGLADTGDAVGAFEDFQIFSDSRQCWPAVWAGQRSSTLAIRCNRLRNNIGWIMCQIIEILKLIKIDEIFNK